MCMGVGTKIHTIRHVVYSLGPRVPHLRREDTHCWRPKVGEDCSSLPVTSLPQSSNQSFILVDIEVLLCECQLDRQGNH